MLLRSLRFGKNKGFVGSLEDTIIKRFAQMYFSLFEEFKEIRPCLPKLITSYTSALFCSKYVEAAAVLIGRLLSVPCKIGF